MRPTYRTPYLTLRWIEMSDAPRVTALARCGFRYTGRASRPCLARGHDMPSIKMVLTREDRSARRVPQETRPA